MTNRKHLTILICMLFFCLIVIPSALCEVRPENPDAQQLTPAEATDFSKVIAEETEREELSNYLGYAHSHKPDELFKLLPDLSLPEVYKGYDLLSCSVVVFRPARDSGEPIRVSNIQSIEAKYSDGVNKVYTLRFDRTKPVSKWYEFIQLEEGYMVRNTESGNLRGIAIESGGMLVQQFDSDALGPDVLEHTESPSAAAWHDTSVVTEENAQQWLRDEEFLNASEQLLEFFKEHNDDIVNE